jgi:hypothetical protein
MLTNIGKAFRGDLQHEYNGLLRIAINMIREIMSAGDGFNFGKKTRFCPWRRNAEMARRRSFS